MTVISSSLLTVLHFKFTSKLTSNHPSQPLQSSPSGSPASRIQEQQVTFIHPCSSPTQPSMSSATGHLHIMPHSKPQSLAQPTGPRIKINWLVKLSYNSRRRKVDRTVNKCYLALDAESRDRQRQPQNSGENVSAAISSSILHEMPSTVQ